MDEKDLALVRELVRKLRELDDTEHVPELERVIDWFTLRFSVPL